MNSNLMTLEDLIHNLKLYNFEFTQHGNIFEFRDCELNFKYENQKIVYNGYLYDIHEFYEDVVLEFVYDEIFLDIDFCEEDV